SLSDVRQARLIWELGGPGHQAANPDEQAFADRAILGGSLLLGDSGTSLAIPLPVSTAVLLIETRGGAHAPDILRQLAPMLESADRQLHRHHRLTELEREVLGLEHSEQVQRALFAISQLSGCDRDMSEVLRGIHEIVGTLMYAENFFILLMDPSHDTVRMLYFVDVEDAVLFDEVPCDDIRHSATWYVLRNGRVLRGTRESIARK